MCPLQVAVGRPKYLADPAAEKPSPQPRAWRLGTGRPPSPQCTQRVTATAGRPSPTAYGRTGPRLQVGVDGGQAGSASGPSTHCVRSTRSGPRRGPASGPSTYCAAAAEPWLTESGASAEGRRGCGWRPAPALTRERMEDSGSAERAWAGLCPLGLAGFLDEPEELRRSEWGSHGVVEFERSAGHRTDPSSRAGREEVPAALGARWPSARAGGLATPSRSYGGWVSC